MNKMGKVVKYEVSEDKKGLLAYFNTGEFYHVHNNEMDSLQKWIHKLLRDRAKCIEILEKYYRMNIYGNREEYLDVHEQTGRYLNSKKVEKGNLP